MIQEEEMIIDKERLMQGRADKILDIWCGVLGIAMVACAIWALDSVFLDAPVIQTLDLNGVKLR